MDWGQFKDRFDRTSKRMVDKMKANATYMGSSLRKTWDKLIREVTGSDGGRER